MNSIESLVAALSAISLPGVFNPYAERCEECDAEDAVEIRRENLKTALKAAVQLKVRTIWIARDLGYRGGRRTGLALTDEAHLLDHSSILGGVELRKPTQGPVMSERTSSIIWRMAKRIDEPLFMWNVFPLHPHEAGKPFSNRCHTSSERAAMSWVLEEVLSILQPDKLFAIGRDAQSCLASAGYSSVALRHPSYGGQNEFIRQVESEYRLTSTRGDDKSQLNLI